MTLYLLIAVNLIACLKSEIILKVKLTQQDS